MECPVCKDTQLVMTERQNIEIDYCPKCRGVWLDRGELDKIIERSQQYEAAAAATQPQSGSFLNPSQPMPVSPPQPQPYVEYGEGRFGHSGGGHYRDEHHGSGHGSNQGRGHGGFLKRLFD